MLLAEDSVKVPTGAGGGAPLTPPGWVFHKSLDGGHDVSRDCNCLTIREGVLPGKGLHLGCQSLDETFRTDPKM